jgi:hypothetical protein
LIVSVAFVGTVGLVVVAIVLAWARTDRGRAVSYDNTPMINGVLDVQAPAGAPNPLDLLVVASPEARRLAGHQWWKGEVRPGAVDLILVEMQSRSAITVFFNKKGEFCTMTGEVKGIIDHPAEYWTMARVSCPAIDRLPGDAKRVVVRAGYGDRLSFRAAVNVLEDYLDSVGRDEAKILLEQANEPVNRMFEKMDGTKLAPRPRGKRP